MVERRTNVDVDELARRPIVRSFMARQLLELPDPATGYVFPVALAMRAAVAFELFYEDGVTMARALLEVAAEVVARVGAARSPSSPAVDDPSVCSRRTS